MSDIIKDLQNNPEYQRLIEKMSSEERQMTEKAVEALLKEFEEKIIAPLKNELKR